MAKELPKGLLLGLGNPLLDISANVDEDFLKKYDLQPNDAILADEKHKPLCDELIEQYKAEFIAGGSVQNTLRIAQWYLDQPHVATFMGCVGKDKYSKILEEKANDYGVNVCYQYHETEPTGTCGVMITDRCRSLCANLAAANCFSLQHVKDNNKYLEAAKYIYISGFFLTVSPETIQEVAKHAHSNDKIFMMNLSAPFLCEIFKKPMMDAFPYVDVLFCNETEAEAFAKAHEFDTTDRKEIALKIMNMEKINDKRKRIVIVTQGADKIILAMDGDISEFDVREIPEERVIDTNGAGDAFVGGFLAEYIVGKKISDCIALGISAGSAVIQRSGCTLMKKTSNWT